MSEKQGKSDKIGKKRTKADLMEEATRKEALTFEELRRVLESCITLEEEVMIKLAVTTGIRREDFASIELMNVDLEERTITFWEEKKDRPWKVPLEPPVIQVLKKYIPTLPANEKHLFPRSGRTYHRYWNNVLKRAGMPPMRFHDLRRTCMRLSRSMGRDIRFVMDLTGDKAETILQEYEGYSITEMNELLEENGILSHTMNNRDLGEKKNRLLQEIQKIDDILKEREGVIV